MCVRILEGVDHDGAEVRAVLFDSVTGTAFGPLFRSRDEAEEFLKYLEWCSVDARRLGQVMLDESVTAFREREEEKHRLARPSIVADTIPLSQSLYTAADLQGSESRCTAQELRYLGDLARALEFPPAKKPKRVTEMEHTARPHGVQAAAAAKHCEALFLEDRLQFERDPSVFMAGQGHDEKCLKARYPRALFSCNCAEVLSARAEGE